MIPILCAAPQCRPIGRHETDCPRDNCRGCLSATAADGLQLCWYHVDHIASDATEAADVWAELALVLTGQGDGIRATNPHPGLNINLLVAEHRATIRQTLVGWTQHIANERGISLPWRWHYIRLPQGVEGPANRVRTVNHNTRGLGRFIADHNQWLAAQPQRAAEASEELAQLVRLGRTLRQASGTRIVQIGPCPQTGEDERRCPGTLRALLRREASLLPSAVTCDADDSHTWDSPQWMKLGRVMNRER